MAANTKLFEPLQVGTMKLSNRIAMAPLTRFRAHDDHVHSDMAIEYYTQRAAPVPGTLIITEATPVSARAGNYPNVPGVYTDAQIKKWKQIVDAVHAKGSYIYLQMWALGRTANQDCLREETGLKVKSSSAVPLLDETGGPPPQPEELTEEEILGLINDYATGAKNAVEGAGFDGVEIHGANGYLVDQFTQDVCNQRTDRWGGSVENRSRFGLEVAKAVSAAVGGDKVGFRISPYNTWQGMGMKDPIPQFTHLVENLKQFKLAYLHIVEARVAGIEDANTNESVDFAIEAWGKTSPILLAGGFKPDTAVQALEGKHKDRDVVMAFGRYFISNPDIVYRIREGIELTPYDRNTFYTPKVAKGYTDYSFSEKYLKETKSA